VVGGDELKIKVAKIPTPRCSCKIFQPDSNTVDPTLLACRERGTRFIDTQAGRVFVCEYHRSAHQIHGSGQDAVVVSQVVPPKA